jgi:hypothetical protein
MLVKIKAEKQTLFILTLIEKFKWKWFGICIYFNALNIPSVLSPQRFWAYSGSQLLQDLKPNINPLAQIENTNND